MGRRSEWFVEIQLPLRRRVVILIISPRPEDINSTLDPHQEPARLQYSGLSGQIFGGHAESCPLIFAAAHYHVE